MPGTRITGVDGSVTIPAAAGAANVNFNRWAADIQHEEHNITDFADSGNADVVMGGLQHLIGTAEGYMDSAAAVTLGTMDDDNGLPTAGFYLASINGSNINYKFDGIISNLRLGVQKRGLTAVTVSFESSGDIEVDQA